MAFIKHCLNCRQDYDAEKQSAYCPHTGELMAHENMSNDQNELRLIAAALRKRIADIQARAAALEHELELVEAKVARLKEGKS